MSRFKVLSNSIVAIDPCYVGARLVEETTINNVLPGIWDSATKQVPDNLFKLPHSRNSELIVWNTEFFSDIEEISEWEETELYVSVDSGQAGFFDVMKYPSVANDERRSWFDDIHEQICGPDIEVPLSEKEIERRLEITRNGRNKWGKDSTDEEFEQIMKATRTMLETYTYTDHAFNYIANVGYGVATASGYGDGGYNVHVHKDDNGNVVAAKIVFIADNDFD